MKGPSGSRMTPITEPLALVIPVLAHARNTSAPSCKSLEDLAGGVPATFSAPQVRSCGAHRVVPAREQPRALIHRSGGAHTTAERDREAALDRARALGGNQGPQPDYPFPALAAGKACHVPTDLNEIVLEAVAPITGLHVVSDPSR